MTGSTVAQPRPKVIALSELRAAVTGQRVYFGYDGAAHFKVGTSINVPRRGGELGITMIMSLAGTELSEHRIQRMFRAYKVSKSDEWVWAADQFVAFLHALIDSGEARIECGTPAEAHQIVSQAWKHRWEIAA